MIRFYCIICKSNVEEQGDGRGNRGKGMCRPCANAAIDAAFGDTPKEEPMIENVGNTKLQEALREAESAAQYTRSQANKLLAEAARQQAIADGIRKLLSLEPGAKPAEAPRKLERWGPVVQELLTNCEEIQRPAKRELVRLMVEKRPTANETAAYAFVSAAIKKGDIVRVYDRCFLPHQTELMAAARGRLAQA